MLNPSNPNAYGLDENLIFCADGSTTAVSIVPTSAGTVYSSAIEIPKDTNGAIAIEVVSVTDPAPATKDLVIYACVGDTITPTIPTNKVQPIAVIPAGVAFTAGTSFQWILPKAFAGYKYLRLCFFQASTGTVSVGSVNAFVHPLV